MKFVCFNCQIFPDHHYKDVRERILAISGALNEELHGLADAGCPVFQFEEPQIHLLAVRRELGLPLAECLAADMCYSLVPSVK